MKNLILTAGLILLISRQKAWGYVDPGFLSSIYQLGYLVILGLLSLFIFRPLNFFKRFISKLKGDKKTSSDDQP
ncbi:hypothetical protein BVX98_04185 [bacterium F11]|nr:hypothetical protein BVX98_04185 [bacterium F11]